MVMVISDSGTELDSRWCQCWRGERGRARPHRPRPETPPGELSLVETQRSPRHHPVLLCLDGNTPLRQCLLRPDYSGNSVITNCSLIPQT